jgi:hypothetical protein
MSRERKEGASLEDLVTQLDVPLELHPAALLLSFFLESGDLSLNHVGFQAFYRLLLGAAGLESQKELLSLAGNFDSLASFCQTMQAVCGQRATSLLRGFGYIGQDEHLSAKEFFERHNFGTFSTRHLQRKLPTAGRTTGMQIPDLLNFSMALQERSPYLSFQSAEGRIIFPVVVMMDGMLLGAGLHCDEGNDLLWGLVDGPIPLEECPEILSTLISDDDVSKHSSVIYMYVCVYV